MQPTLTTQQNQQKLLELQGEVRLLESRKANALKDLERLQTARAKEIPQLEATLKNLKTERDGLTEEIETKKKEVQKLIAAIEETKAGLKFFTEGQIAQINRDISIKLQTLDQREEDLNTKDQILAETTHSIALAEEEIATTGAQLTQKEADLRALDQDLQDLSLLLEKRAQKVTSDMISARGDLLEINEKIEEAKKEKEQLDSYNKRVEEEANTKKAELESFTHATYRLRKEVLAKAQFNGDWEIRLAEREQKVQQREDQMTRTFEDARVKGLL